MIDLNLNFPSHEYKPIFIIDSIFIVLLINESIKVKKNNFLKTLVIVITCIISVFAALSNYRNFSLNIGQHKLLNAVLYSTYEFDDNYYERISSGYPNLTATAIPIKSIMGAYWIQKDSIDKGLDFLRKGNRENPYIGFSDMILANYHQAFGNQDSFAYYTRVAINKLPNSPAHYALMSRVFVLENKIDSLSMMFDKISNRVRTMKSGGFIYLLW